mgnify:CR=1 FL=1
MIRSYRCSNKVYDFAMLTDLMSKTWSGFTTREYKQYKGLTKENLRDNMTNMELLLNALAEESASQLSKERNPEGFVANATVAKEGAEVAKTARDDFERRLGRSVVSPERAIDHLNPSGSLPLNEIGELTWKWIVFPVATFHMKNGENYKVIIFNDTLRTACNRRIEEYPRK